MKDWNERMKEGNNIYEVCPLKQGDKRMPVDGYCSVNVPSGLYAKVKALVKRRGDLGYRSVTEFVAEAVRTKLVEMGETAP